MSAGQLLSVLGRLSAQAAVVVVVILLAQALFRNRLAPRWRCSLWFLLIARLLLPVSAESNVSIFNLFRLSQRPVSPEFEIRRLEADLPFVQPAGSMRPTQVDVPKETPGTRMQPIPTPLIPGLLRSTVPWLCLWLSGLSIVLGMVALRSAGWRRRLARSTRLYDPEVINLVSESTRRLGISKAPFVYECDAVGSPVLYGVLRPRLIFPRRFVKRFSREEIHLVVLHEMIHIKRGDLILNWLTTALQAIHWFNPLVWLGFARWRADRECACDAAVLEVVGRGRSRNYGEIIIRLLEGQPRESAVPGCVGVLDSPAALRTRLSRITQFQPPSRWSAAAVLLLACLAAGCLTDSRIVSARPAKPADSQNIASAPPAQSPRLRTSAAPGAPPASQTAGTIQKEAKPVRVNPAVLTPEPSLASAPPRAVGTARAPAIVIHSQSGIVSVRRPNGGAVAKSVSTFVPNPVIEAPPPGAKSGDPLFVGGVGATLAPYGLSPTAYAKVLDLRDAISLTEDQMVRVGVLFMREDRDQANLGRNASLRMVAEIHKLALNQIRMLLTPAQRVQFNLIPASHGGGLIGMSPIGQLNRLKKLVGLAEAQRWPILRIYIMGTEHLMECQMPALAPKTESVQLAMQRAIRALLTPKQRKIWDATPARAGGGMLVAAN